MAKTITATIKFFDRKKGYGFFTREDGKDIFVHQSAVRSSGFKLSDMQEGRTAEFTYEVNGGKTNTIAIHQIDGAKPSKRKSANSKSSCKMKVAAEPEPLREDAKVDAFHVGRVKFFDVDKGYGFIEIVDEDGLNDLFVHISNIPPELNPLLKGGIYDVCVNRGRDDRILALVLQEHDGEYAEQARKAA